jgi:methyl-accepting chemotaxis protein
MRIKSLASRLTITMSLLMAVALGIAGISIGLQLKGDLVSLIAGNYSRILASRAEEVGKLLHGHWNELAMLSVMDDMKKGSLDKARALVAPVTTSGIVSDVISIAIIDESGKIRLQNGKDIDISGRDYYKAIFKEGLDRYVSDVLIPQSYDKPAVMLTQAVQRPDGKKFGIVMQISLDKLSEIVGAMKEGEGSHGWIVDDRTTFIAHPQAELIMKQTLSKAEGDTAYAKNMRALAQTLSSSQAGSFLGINEKGERTAIFFASIPESRGWKVGIDLLNERLYSAVSQTITLLSFVFVVALVLTIIIALGLARSITRPVALVAAEFRSLASGDADLTKSLSVASRDEIGALAGDFNLFLGKLREMIVDLKLTQEQLGAIGDELRSSVRSSASTVEQIGGRVETMRRHAQSQGQCVSESSSAVEEIARTIENLDELISSQSAAITEASASIEEMVGNISSVSNSVGLIASSFEEISSDSDSGVSLQRAAGERVAEIAALSATLLDANKVIATIASQTNLLAMNAAIEAAHAGEAGKGFSVVADEIRRLAETSTTQSKSIGSGLRDVQDAIGSVVDTTNRTSESFSALAEKIRKTGELVHEVGSAMIEQKEGSSQILLALKSMNEISAQVRAGSTEMSAGNASILESIAKLKTSAQEIDASVVEVVTGIGEVKKDTGVISGIAERTGGLIESLEAAIGRFRT